MRRGWPCLGGNGPHPGVSCGVGEAHAIRVALAVPDLTVPEFPARTAEDDALSRGGASWDADHLDRCCVARSPPADVDPAVPGRRHETRDAGCGVVVGQGERTCARVRGAVAAGHSRLGCEAVGTAIDGRRALVEAGERVGAEDVQADRTGEPAEGIWAPRGAYAADLRSGRVVFQDVPERTAGIAGLVGTAPRNGRRGAFGSDVDGRGTCGHAGGLVRTPEAQQDGVVVPAVRIGSASGEATRDNGRRGVAPDLQLYGGLG